MDVNRLPRGVLTVLFSLTSLLLVFLLIPAHFFFPSLGIAAFFTTITILAIIAKKRKGEFDALICSAIFLLSLFLVLRANAFLNFLTIVTIVFLLSYFLSLPKGIGSLISLLFLPLTRLARTIQAKNLFPLQFSATPSFVRHLKIGQHLPAILITIVLLVIVVPLLSYANPLFQKVVTDTIKVLDLTLFFQNIRANFFVYLIRLLLFVLFLFLLPRIVSDQYSTTSEKNTTAKSTFQINLLIPKVVLSFVLIVFFITQLQLYFSSTETLKALGYTNSQYAREVFSQLSVVAFIIFLLMYADRSRKKVSRHLTTLLIIEGVFLCSIAFKSVWDYTQQYGFTSMRLYGYAGVAWIFGTFVLFAYHYYKNEFNEKFVKHIVAYSTFVVLCINFANFDYLIYHYGKPKVFGVDYAYLSRLSPDSESYEKLLPMLMKFSESERELNKLWPYWAGAYDIINQIEYLQKKYKDLSIGSFNLSEYRTYQKTKHLDTKELRKKVDSYQITPTPEPMQIQSMPAQTTPDSSEIDASEK